MLTTLVRTFRCQTMGQRLAEQGLHVPEFPRKPSRSLLASVAYMWPRMSMRVVHSTRVPTSKQFGPT